MLTSHYWELSLYGSLIFTNLEHFTLVPSRGTLRSMGVKIGRMTPILITHDKHGFCNSIATDSGARSIAEFQETKLNSRSYLQFVQVSTYISRQRDNGGILAFILHTVRHPLIDGDIGRRDSTLECQDTAIRSCDVELEL